MTSKANMWITQIQKFKFHTINNSKNQLEITL